MRRLRRLVAVAKESLVGLVTADYQVIGKLRQMLGGIGRNIVRDDNLVAHVLRMLQNRLQA